MALRGRCHRSARQEGAARSPALLLSNARWSGSKPNRHARGEDKRQRRGRLRAWPCEGGLDPPQSASCCHRSSSTHRLALPSNMLRKRASDLRREAAVVACCDGGELLPHYWLHVCVQLHSLATAAFVP